MPVERSRLRLTDGVVFIVNSSPDILAASVQHAIATGQVIEVENDHGVRRRINPLHVIYVEPMTVTVEEQDVDG